METRKLVSLSVKWEYSLIHQGIVKQNVIYVKMTSFSTIFIYIVIIVFTLMLACDDLQFDCNILQFDCDSLSWNLWFKFSK